MQVNNDTARPAGFHLDLWRWETDSRPGFNPMGPQGMIDKVLEIPEIMFYFNESRRT